jgi:hypothetical protein
VHRVLVAFAVTLVSLPLAAADRDGVAPKDILGQSTTLRAEVLELALRAYQRAVDAGAVRRAVLTIIDYELPSYDKRLWVVDMSTGKVVHEEWVAHGMGRPRGSGGNMTHALGFSNDLGSRKSSLGLYITAEAYYGEHGYTVRLDGLERGINDNARDRMIVLHGADYVTPERAASRQVGRSWGCPTVREEVSESLIDTIKEGTALWIYYPDSRWLEQSEFLDSDQLLEAR